MMSGGKSRTAVSTGAAELGLTKKEIKQCRKAFAFYDKNGVPLRSTSHGPAVTVHQVRWTYIHDDGVCVLRCAHRASLFAA